MGFFHVLFAITLPLRLVWTWMEVASVQGRRGRMLVVDVPVSLFFGGPSVRAVLARRLRTLPGSRVSLFMLTGPSQQDVDPEDGGRLTSNHKGA